MDYKKYLGEMKMIQQNLLDLLDYENDVEEKYQNLKNLFDDIKIHDDKYKIKSMMYLLLHISKNHHREEGFFSKIEQILKYFKDDFQKYFSNSELFHIFESSKRILLFLVEEKIMNFDEFIAKQIMKDKYLDNKYPEYFQPEIQPFLTEKWFPKYNENREEEEEEEYDNDDAKKNKWVLEIQKEISSDFYDKRKIGENDEFICRLIQKDLIEEFIIYVNKNDYSLRSIINISKYETNSFLLKNKKITLIEYAAFFGSTQIFKYLYKNGDELTPTLWLYGIHSDNPEMIHLLEENEVKPPNESYEECIKESIKCHHNDVTNYIQSNLINKDIPSIDDIEYTKNYDRNIYSYSFHYYNYSYFPIEMKNKIIFYYGCQYDFFEIVEYFINIKKIDINEKIIYIKTLIKFLI